MTEKDLIIQDLRQENEWLKKRIELAERTLEPVVHCGSCRHADSKHSNGWLWCNEWQAGSNCEGYCFKGEREVNDGST